MKHKTGDGCRLVRGLAVGLCCAAGILYGCDGTVGSNGENGENGTVPDNAARLTWTAPTTNDDANQTPLTDLAGYFVHYGQTSRSDAGFVDYEQTVDIAMPTTCESVGSDTECSHLVEELGSGVWYFTVSAYDTSGNRSDFSNEASKTIE